MIQRATWNIIARVIEGCDGPMPVRSDIEITLVSPTLPTMEQVHEAVEAVDVNYNLLFVKSIVRSGLVVLDI